MGAAVTEIENVGCDFLSVRRYSPKPEEVPRKADGAQLAPAAVQPCERRFLRACRVNQNSVERCVKFRPPDSPKNGTSLATGTGSPMMRNGPRRNAAPAGSRYGRKRGDPGCFRLVRREGYLSVGWHERSLAAGCQLLHIRP